MTNDCYTRLKKIWQGPGGKPLPRHLKMDSALARLPPVMLDWVGPDYITRDELSMRGYHLPCYPFQDLKGI
jgi:hypothetical protein